MRLHVVVIDPTLAHTAHAHNLSPSHTHSTFALTDPLTLLATAMKTKAMKIMMNDVSIIVLIAVVLITLALALTHTLLTLASNDSNTFLNGP